MTPLLTIDDARNQFFALGVREDVAAILDISWERLRYLLYRRPNAERYSIFTIPKKSGDSREIFAPKEDLKEIQRRLCFILESVYDAKPSVHGFTQSRSVLTNAHIHTRRKYILNVDLLNFFPSINFGRVRGMFMAKPYNCNQVVATILAQICCHDSKLPQGAPTSPIVSNMICARMDRQLQDMAKYYRCSYTRYADDITISTSLGEFPIDIASIQTVSGAIRCVAGKSLVDVIEANGFKINEKKIRLQSNKERQEVTGLTTNKFPNVQRHYVRQIRSMLHAWRKFGENACLQEYMKKYYRGHRNPKRSEPAYRKIVKGKIEYLGMIRGKDDVIYQRFINQLRELAPDMVKANVINDPFADVLNNLIVLETYEGTEINQGTAFHLEGYGFVTCAHVLGKEIENTTAYTRHDRKEYPVRVIAKDDDLDLAILDVDISIEGGLKLGSSESLKMGDAIKLVGFPNHNYGDSGIVALGGIIGFRTPSHSPAQRILISENIIFGNSGGPVLDANDNVIGVAVTGASDEEQSRRTEHGVIPIEAIERLIKATDK